MLYLHMFSFCYYYPFLLDWWTPFTISCKKWWWLISSAFFHLGKVLSPLHVWRKALVGTVFLITSFFLLAFWICHLALSCPVWFLLKSLLLDELMLFYVLFPSLLLLIFGSFLCLWPFKSLVSICLGVVYLVIIWFLFVWWFLTLLYIDFFFFIVFAFIFL